MKACDIRVVSCLLKNWLLYSEQFHSTPETQTEESYTHPEDLEHFAQHESIERKEAEREAVFQGVTVEEILKLQQELAAAAAAQEPRKAVPVSKPVNRVPPPEKQEPAVKYKDASTVGARKGDWGTGEAGYKPPTEPGEKLRWGSSSKVILTRLFMNLFPFPAKISPTRYRSCPIPWFLSETLT